MDILFHESMAVHYPNEPITQLSQLATILNIYMHKAFPVRSDNKLLKWTFTRRSQDVHKTLQKTGYNCEYN